MSNITGYTDEYVRLPNNKYQKANNEFKGWALSQDGEIIAYDNDLYKVGTNQYITLYAVWKDWTGYTAIKTAADLKNINKDWSKNYYLANDIDLNGETWEPIGSVMLNNDSGYGCIPFYQGFHGILDGNGYSICNFTMGVSINEKLRGGGNTYYGFKKQKNGFYYAGLFLYNYGTIQNLTIKNVKYNIKIVCDLTPSDETAYGQSYETRFSYQSYLGGIVAYNAGTISNCAFFDNITYDINAGGISKGGIAAATSGDNNSISNCYSQYEKVVSQGNSSECTQNINKWHNGKKIIYSYGDNREYSLLKGNEKINLTKNYFVKEGYSFIGWALSENGEVQYNDRDVFEIGLNEQYVTLYPVWEANNNAIVFNANGGEGKMPNQNAQTDSSVTLNPNTYIRTGYHFIGWATTADGEVVYLDRATYDMGTDAEYTLYAVWEANTNQIVFMPNGGSGTMINQESLTDSNITLNACSFVAPTGYYFAGWATTPDGEIEYTDCASYHMGINASYTLYAKWDYN